MYQKESRIRNVLMFGLAALTVMVIWVVFTVIMPWSFTSSLLVTSLLTGAFIAGSTYRSHWYRSLQWHDHPYRQVVFKWKGTLLEEGTWNTIPMRRTMLVIRNRTSHTKPLRVGRLLTVFGRTWFLSYGVITLPKNEETAIQVWMGFFPCTFAIMAPEDAEKYPIHKREDWWPISHKNRFPIWRRWMAFLLG